MVGEEGNAGRAMNIIVGIFICSIGLVAMFGGVVLLALGAQITVHGSF